MKSQENPLNRPESTTPIYVVGTAGNLPVPSNPTPETGAKKATQVSLVYTIPEAAAVLNVSTKTIRRLIDRRFLTPCGALRKKLIPKGQIEAFLKATCDTPKTFN
jgi:excisionase family DNA binding protein